MVEAEQEGLVGLESNGINDCNIVIQWNSYQNGTLTKITGLPMTTNLTSKGKPNSFGETPTLLLWSHGSYPQQRAAGRFLQLHPPQSLLVTQKQLSFPAKTKIRYPTGHQYFADQRAALIPDVDAVSTAAVDVAKGVAFDSDRSTRVGHGEDALVREERR